MEIKKEEEKKPESPQAPAQGEPEKPQEGQQAKTPEEKAGPTGLDRLTPEDLKKLYDRSPQMFKDAGIVPKEEAKPPEKKEAPKEEKKVEAPPTASAAPKYGDVEIKLPTDVKVNADAVASYLAHAKEIGLSPQQVQAEIDFQTKQARAALAASQPKAPAPAPEEVDAANVGRLKADPEFGKDFEANMDLARRAAVKFGDKETLAKLATSDPVLVKHFWKLAKADAEDQTRAGPNRNGEEDKREEEDLDPRSETYLRRRYKNSPGMTFGRG